MSLRASVQLTRNRRVSVGSHRSHQNLKVSSNRFLSKKWDEREYILHRQRLADVKSSVDDRAPPAFVHLQVKLRSLQIQEERLATVERNNRILLERMSHIMRTRGYVDNVNTYEPKSLNKLTRQQDILRITHENRAILKRILTTQPATIKREEWETDFRKHIVNVNDIATYPYGWWRQIKDKRNLKRLETNFDTSARITVDITAPSTKLRMAKKPKISTERTKGRRQSVTRRASEPRDHRHSVKIVEPHMETIKSVTSMEERESKVDVGDAEPKRATQPIEEADDIAEEAVPAPDKDPSAEKVISSTTEKPIANLASKDDEAIVASESPPTGKLSKPSKDKVRGRASGQTTAESSRASLRSKKKEKAGSGSKTAESSRGSLLGKGTPPSASGSKSPESRGRLLSKDKVQAPGSGSKTAESSRGSLLGKDKTPGSGSKTAECSRGSLKSKGKASAASGSTTTEKSRQGVLSKDKMKTSSKTADSSRESLQSKDKTPSPNSGLGTDENSRDSVLSKDKVKSAGESEAKVTSPDAGSDKEESDSDEPMPSPDIASADGGNLKGENSTQSVDKTPTETSSKSSKEQSPSRSPTAQSSSEDESDETETPEANEKADDDVTKAEQ